MCLLLLSSVSKHNMWSYYDWVCCCFRLSVSTICGRIMIGLSLLSVSKHNMWSYYDWVYCCCRPSVNTICGRIMIGLLSSSVSTICSRVMIGLSFSSVCKHNMWSCYDHILCLTTDDNDNPIITRPRIVLTDGRQQRQPNHNTTAYCV